MRSAHKVYVTKVTTDSDFVAQITRADINSNTLVPSVYVTHHGLFNSHHPTKLGRLFRLCTPLSSEKGRETCSTISWPLLKPRVSAWILCKWGVIMKCIKVNHDLKFKFSSTTHSPLWEWTGWGGGGGIHDHPQTVLYTQSFCLFIRDLKEPESNDNENVPWKYTFTFHETVLHLPLKSKSMLTTETTWKRGYSDDRYILKGASQLHIFHSCAADECGG